MTFNELKIGDWFYTNKGQEEIEMKISNTQAIIIYHKNKLFIGLIGDWKNCKSEIVYCSSFNIEEPCYHKYYFDGFGNFYIKSYDGTHYCFWSARFLDVGTANRTMYDFCKCDAFFSSDTFTFYVPEVDKIFLKPIDKTKFL